MRHDTHGSDLSDAVAILHAYKQRITNLEQAKRGDHENVRLVREVNESLSVADSVTVTTGTDAAFTYGSSRYSYDEYGDES